MRPTGLPTLDDVDAARERLRPHLAPTPLLAAPELGPDVLLKLETLQPTGSFKVRGALAALTLLEPGTAVVAASAGNHALGVAHAASVLGLRATVVCPETASAAKVEKLRALPVELRLHGRVYDEAERLALELAANGARYVSPYNDRDVIAGQGTVATEILERLDGHLAIVCPVGGGGLLSGVALCAGRRAGARVVGVACEASPALATALEAGRIVPVGISPTVADGLAGNLEPGSITVELARRHVEEIVVVTEAEIEDAMRFLARTCGVVAEGAGATAMAALLAGRVTPTGTTVVLVTGRNVSPATLERVLEAA